MPSHTPSTTYPRLSGFGTCNNVISLFFLRIFSFFAHLTSGVAVRPLAEDAAVQGVDVVPDSEHQHPQLPVLELLPGEEPGRDGGHRHPYQGHSVRGDEVRDPGVGHRQVCQRLIQKLEKHILIVGFKESFCQFHS